MARPLVHRTVHKGDRPGGGSGWACPFCPQQVVFWPLFHKVMVKGQADALHVRAIREVPVHLDDIVVELTEADENWLASTPSPGLAWWPDEELTNTPVMGPN